MEMGGGAVALVEMGGVAGAPAEMGGAVALAGMGGAAGALAEMGAWAVCAAPMRMRCRCHRAASIGTGKFDRT